MIAGRGALPLALAAALGLAAAAAAQTATRQAFRVGAGSDEVRYDCRYRAVAGAGTEQARSFKVGCVYADVVWPPEDSWSQSYDNLAFAVDVTNHSGSESLFLLSYADETLVGADFVATPAPGHAGQSRARTLWPFPGPSDFRIRYWTADGPIDAVGDPTRADQRLLGSVKVHNLRFWNLSDAVGTVAVPAIQVQPVVDRLNDYVYNAVTDDSVDAVYGQCPSATHTQFRYTGIGNMAINVTPSCVDMTTWTGNANTCAARYQACINAIFAQVLAADPTLEQIHVVFVDNYGSNLCGNNVSTGTHRLVANYNAADPDPANHGYMILIEDGVPANPDALARLLAHEVGHTYLGGHTNNNNPCPPPTTTRNVMCSNTGRLINATQCQSAASNTNLRYQDQN